MKEETIVRENLMNQEGYTGYCGSELGLPRTRDYSDRWPRTKWVPELNQFKCHRCGWVSQYPEDFIKRYKARWSLQ